MNPEDYIRYRELPLINLGQNTIFRNVYAFEKMDGANAQVRCIDGKITPGSRGKPISTGAFNRPWKLNFYNWTHTIPEFQSIPPTWIVYGEWLSPHTMGYDEFAKNNFYLIDLLDLTLPKPFVPYEYAIEILSAKNLIAEDRVRTIPFIKGGRIDSETIKNWTQQSHFYDGPMEGVVIKDYTSQTFLKYLTPQFSEVRYNSNISAEQKYITLRRLEKICQALQDDEEPVDLATVTREVDKVLRRENGVALPKQVVEERVKDLWLPNSDN